MLNPKNREGLPPVDAQFLEIVDKYGWHVMSVCPRADSDDKQEWFSYSTGLFMRHAHPEIIIFGLSSQNGLGIINHIGEKIKAGKAFELDKDQSGILADGFKCRFREVHRSQYAEYVCSSIWFYEGEDFPVWQCFWPDDGGHFPWDASCDPSVVEAQPMLFNAHP